MLQIKHESPDERQNEMPEQANQINDRDVQSCITMKQRMGKSAAILNNVHSLTIVIDLLM